MKDFKIEYRIQDDACIVSPEGMLTGGNNFTQILSVVKGENIKKVLLNGRQLNFIDSSGIGAIIDLFKGLQTEGKILYLCELQKDIFDLLIVSGIDSFITIHTTESEAIMSD